MNNLTKLLGGDNAGKRWVKLYRRMNGAWVAELWESGNIRRTAFGQGITAESALHDLEDVAGLEVIEDYNLADAD